MKRRISFGFSSILISFIMICVVTFSALALITANADYKLSKKVSDRNKAYYDAEQAAYNRIDTIDANLEKIYQQFDGASAYVNEAQKEITGGEWSEVSDTSAVFTFTEQIEDNQYLKVSLQVKYPDATSKTFYRTTCWCTYTVEEPYEEQPLNLMGSDNSND